MPQEKIKCLFLTSIACLIIHFLSSGHAAGTYSATYHEGSIQVPIPCAVVNVVFITTLIIALVALSGKSALREFIKNSD